MRIEATDTVLDMGCGEGGNASFCARRGCDIILVDVNETILGRARAALDGLGARSVRTVVSTALPLPLPDGCATKLVCTEVLEHVEDPAAVMAELVRLGRPGAQYLFSVPDPVQETVQAALAPPGYFRAPNHVRIIERDAFAALVTDAGLAIERRAQYGFFWSVYISLYWRTGFARTSSDHPVLNAWSELWSAVLAGPEGVKVVRALDAALPKSQIIVARKPAAG